MVCMLNLYDKSSDLLSETISEKGRNWWESLSFQRSKLGVLALGAVFGNNLRNFSLYFNWSEKASVRTPKKLFGLFTPFVSNYTRRE